MIAIESRDLLFSLLNPSIFPEAKRNVDLLREYFGNQVSGDLSMGPGNNLVDSVLDVVEKYSPDSIGEPLFRHIVSNGTRTEAEVESLVSKLNMWRGATKDQVDPYYDRVQEVCAKTVLDRGYKLHKDSPAALIEYIRNSGYNKQSLGISKTINFADIDIDAIVRDMEKGAIRTGVPLLDRSFPPYVGVERGQLGIITAAPGTGKTLISMTIAFNLARDGEDVIYYCLGDMTEKDFVQRFVALARNISFADAHKDIRNSFEYLVSLLGRKLTLRVVPAGELDADTIVTDTLRGGFTVAIIDYDGNLKGASDGDSMYNTFGNIYNTLTKLTLSGVSLFVDAQPKVYAWNQQIEMSDIGESSKKQHAADWIMTISNVNPDCPNHLYTMKLVKARRGEVGNKDYVIRIQGNFHVIEKGLYDNLRIDTEPRNYTYGDLERIKTQYRLEVGKVENDVSMKMSGFQQPIQLNNPFLQ